MRFVRLPSFTLLAGLAALPCLAQTVPARINYQGRLTDNSPSQVPVNATVNMQFEIWDVASGGTITDRLWQEPLSGSVPVTVTEGIFNVLLGSSQPLPVSLFSSGTARYLQIISNGEALSPRQTIAATGYANQAENAANAASAASVPFSGLTGVPSLCAPSMYLRGYATGSAVCAADNPGTVTSLATGAGLTGGPITGSGTVNLLLNASGGLSKTLGAGSNELGVAPGGVTGAMIAGNTITATNVKTGSGVYSDKGSLYGSPGGTTWNSAAIPAASTAVVVSKSCTGANDIPLACGCYSDSYVDVQLASSYPNFTGGNTSCSCGFKNTSAGTSHTVSAYVVCYPHP